MCDATVITFRLAAASPAVTVRGLRAASQGQVAEAFGVDPATIWRWDQALASAGVAG